MRRIFSSRRARHARRCASSGPEATPGTAGRRQLRRLKAASDAARPRRRLPAQDRRRSDPLGDYACNPKKATDAAKIARPSEAALMTSSALWLGVRYILAPRRPCSTRTSAIRSRRFRGEQRCALSKVKSAASPASCARRSARQAITIEPSRATRSRRTRATTSTWSNASTAACARRLAGDAIVEGRTASSRRDPRGALLRQGALLANATLEREIARNSSSTHPIDEARRS